MTMTLEQIRDVFTYCIGRGMLTIYGGTSVREIRDSLDAHLSQPQPVAQVQSCKLCFGRGERTADGSNGRRVRCKTCDGTGQISRTAQPQPVAQGEAVGEFYVKCVRCHGEGMADIYVGSTGGSFNQPPDPVFERDACPECDGACFVLATPAIPTGHRVVPVEPTEDMTLAAAKSVSGEWDDESADVKVGLVEIQREAIRDAIAAAPDAGGV